MISEVDPLREARFKRAEPTAHGMWRSWVERVVGRSFDSEPYLVVVEIDTHKKVLNTIQKPPGKKIEDAFEKSYPWTEWPPCWPDNQGRARGVS